MTDTLGLLDAVCKYIVFNVEYALVSRYFFFFFFIN